MPAPRERDFEQTRKQLESWLTTRLPAAEELHVSSLSGPATTGFSSDTLLFDACYREDGAERRLELVARLEPTGFGVFPEYDVALQARVMQAVARAGVAVPHVHWLENSHGPLDVPFYVMERVEGRIPPDNPPYHMGGWMTEIEPAERASIWWSGLESMAAIHRCDWRGLGLADLVPPAALDDPLGAQLDSWRRYLDWTHAWRQRPQPVPERAFEWLVAQRPQAPQPLGLCWGDARIGNMIFRDGRCVAVLDWEMATLGNPEQDLAWFLYLDAHHSEGVEAERLPGFPGREETVARYEQSLGRPVEHLEYYEIFAAFRFAAIMIRVGQQLIHYGLIPEASSFDRDNPAARLLEKRLAQLG